MKTALRKHLKLNLTFMGPCIVRIFKYISNKLQRYTVYYIWRLFYMFRVVPPLINRSPYNFIYSIWYLSHRYCYLTLSWKSGLSVLWVAYATHSTLKSVPTLPRYRQIAVTVWQIPDAVDTVVCASDNGWKYHPKHVEQFPDIINCVTLYLVGYMLECLKLILHDCTQFIYYNEHASDNFSSKYFSLIQFKTRHSITPHTSANVTITQNTELVIYRKANWIVHSCNSSRSFIKGGKTKCISDATTVDTVL
jgi:hypothetical protein